jgi:spermidine/putrescine-binding protein
MSSISRRHFLKSAASTLAGSSLLSASSALLTACGERGGTGEGAGAKKLNVFSWADYLHPDTIPEFEKRYGIQVTYDTFASNEMLTARIESGSTDYDIIVPTNYAVGRLLKLKLLSEIDHARLPNYKYLMERFRNLSYDPGNKYSIPYTFGSTGLAFNKEAFSKRGLPPPTDWDAFWDPRFGGRMTLLEDARETVGFAMKKHGYSYNSVDPKQIEVALKDLEQQKKYVMCYTSDQVKTLLATGDALLSLSFSGDANQARRSNKNVRYIIPASGASMWIDNMCVPASAPHMESAYLWMNYILEPAVAAMLTNFTYFPTPNSEGVKLVNKELLTDETLYPSDAIMNRLEEINDIGDGIFLYDRAWTELKCM